MYIIRILKLNMTQRSLIPSILFSISHLFYFPYPTHQLVKKEVSDELNSWYILQISKEQPLQMKSELKKLKGITIKTTIGQINFKDQVRQQNSEFDQIYFKTTFKESLCKIYDLTRPVSNERYNNQVIQYHSICVPVLYSNIHCEKFKYKKKEYGLVLFIQLRKQWCLETNLSNLTEAQTLKLTRNLLILVNSMKAQEKIYNNIRPTSIFKYASDFFITDSELITKKNTQNEIFQFIKGNLEKDWEYWPPQMLDEYSTAVIDYNIDLFAVGCILYQIKIGVYPFETKLAEIHLNYKKIENEDSVIEEIIGKCLTDLGMRREFNIEYYIDKIDSAISSENSPVKKDLKQKIDVRKGSGNGLFDGLSSVFTKMLNETQGAYLNYIENNDKEPTEKYLENLLIKIYKGEDKMQKLAAIINKYMNTILDKPWSILKSCLLIGQILRKGPLSSYKCLKDYVKELSDQKLLPEVSLMAELLIMKINVYKRVKKCMLGNFYVFDVSKFNTLEIKDIGHMVAYLEKLTGYLKKYVSDYKGSELITMVINFICDDIYDLVSMLVMSIIALRKDNDLQLRNDNLSELPAVEKVLNSNLKKISYLSNFTGAHAIYSIQNDYISYQEEINLVSNPYFSSLEYFYRSSRGYKGLSLPQNFQIQYSNSQERPTLVKQPSGHNPVSPEKKSYFSTGQEEDSDEEGHIQTLQKSYSNFNEYMVKQVQPKKPVKKSTDIKIEVKSKQKTHKKKEDEIQPKSIKNNNSNNSVSFDDFINITKRPPKQDKKEINKTENQFSLLFSQIKPSIPKSPDARKKQITNKASCQAYGFEEFTKPAQKSLAKNNSSLIDLGFEELSKMKSPPLFQNNPFENFTDQIIFKAKSSTTSTNNLLNFQNFEKIKSTEVASPNLVPSNPYLDAILAKLRLKELKQLLKKNQKFIIPYSELVLNKVIGSGSAGEVFSGKYKNSTVAIKKVKIKENPNALKQFERELVTYIKIKGNTNLLSLMGLSEYNSDFYLVTQFCEYGSLFDLLHKNLNVALGWEDRLRFAIQIAEGMLYLHSMKPVIIHRDLKSLNVFVAKNEKSGFEMKVADFGLSRSPEAEMMTTQLGTIHWMAPELLEGKQYSLKVDVYSYGVLLWQILARKTPYQNLQNPMAILKYVVIDKKRPDLSLIPDECPKKLIDIVQKCWAHDSSLRPSFSTIIQQLKMISL